MPQTFSTKAIVLDRQDFRENDIRVVVYTKDNGKLELVAKGAKKSSSKMAAHIEPLNLANMLVVGGKQFNYIGSAVACKCFIDIKNNFDKVNAAYNGISIFNKLIKPEYVDKEIFYLLEDFLNSLNNNFNLDIISSAFKLRLLSSLGYEPNLYSCVVCNKKIASGNLNRFNSSLSGLVCPNCKNKSSYQYVISDDCVKCLRLIIKFNFQEILKIKLSDKLINELKKNINIFLKCNMHN